MDHWLTHNEQQGLSNELLDSNVIGSVGIAGRIAHAQATGKGQT